VELPEQLAESLQVNPRDRDLHLVAADWLSQHGDPHGELIALSCAPESAEIRARIAALKLEVGGAAGDLELDWRWGFVRGVRVGPDGGEWAGQLTRILSSPVARFVERLEIRELPDPALDAVIAAGEIDRRGLSSMRVLELDLTRFATLDLELVSRWFPGLTRLTASAAELHGTLKLDHVVELRLASRTGEGVLESPLHAPKLRRLELESTAASDLLIASHLPELRRLEVQSFDAEPLEWLRDLECPRLELVAAITGVRSPVRSFLVDRYPGGPRATALLVIDGWQTLPAGLLIPVPGDRVSLDGDPGGVDVAPTDAELPVEIIREAGAWHLALGHCDRVRFNGYEIEGGKRRPTLAMRSCDELGIGHHRVRFLEGDIEELASENRRWLALPDLCAGMAAG